MKRFRVCMPLRHPHQSLRPQRTRSWRNNSSRLYQRHLWIRVPQVRRGYSHRGVAAAKMSSLDKNKALKSSSVSPKPRMKPSPSIFSQAVPQAVNAAYLLNLRCMIHCSPRHHAGGKRSSSPILPEASSTGHLSRHLDYAVEKGGQGGIVDKP